MNLKSTITSFFKKSPLFASTVLIFAFILIEFTFSFCSKVHCNAFDDKYYDEYFPYKLGQTQYFSSETGARDTIIISSTEKSKAADRYASTSGVNCGTSAQITARESSKYSYRFYVSYYKSDVKETNNNNNVQVSFRDLTIQGVNINENGVIVNRDIYKSKFLPSLQINGVSFSNVNELEIDSTFKTKGIYKIWIAKKIGVVGYEYIENNQKWNLIP